MVYIVQLYLAFSGNLLKSIETLSIEIYLTHYKNMINIIGILSNSVFKIYKKAFFKIYKKVYLLLLIFENYLTHTKFVVILK